METQSFEELQKIQSVVQPLDIKEREIKEELMQLDVDFGNLESYSTKENFTGRPISDMPFLSEYPQLKELTWRNLSNDELITFFIGYTNWRLESLDLSRDVCREGELIMQKQLPKFRKSIWNLGNYSHLRELNLAGTLRMTDDILYKLFQFNWYIRHLNLSCTALTTIPHTISQRREIRELEHLNVSNNYLKDEDAAFIHQHFLNLRYLDLSRNELTDDGVRAIFQLDNPTARLRYETLDVSNQKINYILPQTIERIQDKIRKGGTIEPIPLPELKFDETKWVYIRKEFGYTDPNDSDEEPDIQFHTIQELVDRFPNITVLKLWNDFIHVDLQPLSEFKHLHDLKISQIDSKNPTIKHLLEHKTIQKLTLTEFITWNLKSANQIRNNHMLKELIIDGGLIDIDIVFRILESNTIHDLKIVDMIFTWKKQLTYAQFYELLVQKIRQNHVLTNFQMDGKFNFIDPTIHPRGGVRVYYKQITEHLEENRFRLQATQQILPLLAATQLGGKLRHSAIDVLPIVYNFLAMPPPPLAELSQQIEPAPLTQEEMTRKKRSRAIVQSQTPLPFMFEK